jgi:hypothetical protein
MSAPSEVQITYAGSPIAVYLHSLRLYRDNDQLAVIVLAERSGSRYITINAPKPRVDLIKHVLTGPVTPAINREILALEGMPGGARWRLSSRLSPRIHKMLISAYVEPRFAAEIFLLGQNFSVFASVAVLLATRDKAPMYVAEQVLAAVGCHFEAEDAEAPEVSSNAQATINSHF